MIAPGKREDVLDRFSCHTAICPDSMGFYTKASALARVAQASTAASAIIGLWYGLEVTSGQASVENGSVLAIVMSLAVSLGLSQLLGWLIGQFRYVYTPADQQKDLAKLTNLTEGLRSEEHSVGYRP